MKYSIRKNWLETLNLIKTKPIVIMPFVFIAFLECIVLELVFFSTRFPLSYVANPVIRKFFGENFVHYPANLIILPQLFYYFQVAIYIFIGVFLTGVTVNIFKNLIVNLPIKVKALIKNAFTNYFSFFMYAIIVTILFYLIRTVELYVLAKVFRKLAKVLPFNIAAISAISTILILFISNLILQVLVISTIPLMVLNKMRFFRAMIKSVVIGVKNFSAIFIMILLPFLIYFPIVFIKSFSAEIAAKTFPGMNVVVSLIGILASMFLDCFIILCISRFLLDRAQAAEVKAS
jgi:hypothetical protein